MSYDGGEELTKRIDRGRMPGVSGHKSAAKSLVNLIPVRFRSFAGSGQPPRNRERMMVVSVSSPIRGFSMMQLDILGQNWLISLDHKLLPQAGTWLLGAQQILI